MADQKLKSANIINNKYAVNYLFIDRWMHAYIFLVIRMVHLITFVVFTIRIQKHFRMKPSKWLPRWSFFVTTLGCFPSGFDLDPQSVRDRRTNRKSNQKYHIFGILSRPGVQIQLEPRFWPSDCQKMQFWGPIGVQIGNSGPNLASDGVPDWIFAQFWGPDPKKCNFSNFRRSELE